MAQNKTTWKPLTLPSEVSFDITVPNLMTQHFERRSFLRRLFGLPARPGNTSGGATLQVGIAVRFPDGHIESASTIFRGKSSTPYTRRIRVARKFVLGTR